MSDTKRLPDECKKLLDNGWQIVLFGNGMGSYTAVAVRDRDLTPEEMLDELPDQQITDDFEPSQALYRLTEKVLGNIA